MLSLFCWVKHEVSESEKFEMDESNYIMFNQLTNLNENWIIFWMTSTGQKIWRST